MERIFIRRDGANVEISRSEWRRLHPDREPVVVRAPRDERQVFTANITHNLAPMAREVGLYELLWRPEEIGVTVATQLVEPLRQGLARLHAESEHLQQFNPANGWGSYALLAAVTADYLAACERWPDAEVRVWR